MPTWLVHGFRWPRPAIRIHTIIQNLDDVAAEWLMAPQTHFAMTENFKKLYPEMMIHLPSLRFIEQYDPEDITTKSQPYAYVCDQVHEVQLGVDIDEVRGQGVANDAWSAMADLRDKVAAGEKVAWFVVVNGDVERWVPPTEEEAGGSANGTPTSPISARSSVGRKEEFRKSAGRIEEEDEDSDQTKRPPKGLKKWFGGKARRAKSSKDLRGDSMFKSGALSPPLPNRPFPAAVNKPANGKAHMPAGTAV